MVVGSNDLHFDPHSLGAFGVWGSCYTVDHLRGVDEKTESSDFCPISS